MYINNRVRGILINRAGRLVLIKRIKPDAEPYWVTPGGGVEKDDPSLEAALQREIQEELGGEIEILKLVFRTEHTIEEEHVIVQHFFLCRLSNYDTGKRSGPEFGDPAKGEYIVESFQRRPAVLEELDIMTHEVKQFLIEHIEKIFDLPDLRPSGKAH